MAELSQRTIALEAWKTRLELEPATNKTQPKYITRNRHLLKVPIEVGPKRWSIWPKLIKCWNGLPSEMKLCPDPKRAKVLNRKLYSIMDPTNNNKTQQRD